MLQPHLAMCKLLNFTEPQCDTITCSNPSISVKVTNKWYIGKFFEKPNIAHVHTKAIILN